MKIVIGADHGGFEMKNELVSYLTDKGYAVVDIGPKEYDADDDYPDFGRKVAEIISREGSELNQKKVMGILICRSSGGVIVAANKFKGVRAVSVFDDKMAKHAREHNDANVIGLSGDWTPIDDAKKIVDIYLNTPYSSEERHTRRIKKILDMER